LENFRAMLGEERFVAGDNDLAAADGLEDEFARFLDAAHQFDDYLDRPIIEQFPPVCGEEIGWNGDRPLLRRILDRNLAHNEIATDPFTEKRPVFFQIKENPGADRSKSGQTDTYLAHS
jgi:hypothetical protein